MLRGYSKKSGHGVLETQELESGLISKQKARSQMDLYKKSGYRNLHLRTRKNKYEIYGSI